MVVFCCLAISVTDLLSKQWARITPASRYMRPPPPALKMRRGREGRLLRYLGEPIEPPRRSPDRDSPHCKSKVLRRKLDELS